jgi:hypothetical protein
MSICNVDFIATLIHQSQGLGRYLRCAYDEEVERLQQKLHDHKRIKGYVCFVNRQEIEASVAKRNQIELARHVTRRKETRSNTRVFS